MGTLTDEHGTPLYDEATGEAYGVPSVCDGLVRTASLGRPGRRPTMFVGDYAHDPETGRLAVWRKPEAANDNVSEADVLAGLLGKLVEKHGQPATAAGLAEKAAGLVSGDRDRQHGEKAGNFERIAIMWDTYLKTRASRGPLRAVDVGHMMVLMKLARTQSGDLNLDDYVDMIGYAACAGEIAAA